MKKIPVLKPTPRPSDYELIEEVLESSWWGKGPKVEELEKTFAKRVGTKYATAVNSGTAALDMALKAYDIKDGEIIVPTMTFTSTAAVAYWQPNLRARLVDCRADDLNINLDFLETHDDTKAIIPVHMAGNTVDLKAFREMYGGIIIEDCAHACFNPDVAKYSDIQCWSFQAVKTCPAGDGGMLTYNDPKIHERLKELTWMGIKETTYDRAKGKYNYDYDIKNLGYKTYMNDLNAALVLSQLQHVDRKNAWRSHIVSQYVDRLPNMECHVYFSPTKQYAIFSVSAPKDRDPLIEHLAKDGIMTSVHFKPLHLMTFYKERLKENEAFPIADILWKRLISLPCHDDVTEEDIDHITKSINKYYEN